MAEEKRWITVKGTAVPIDEKGSLQGKVGKKIEKETEIFEKKQKIKNALQEIADGKEEVTLPKLRDDLEQYGGTNDITLIRGNKKEGIIHIIENGREHYLGDILDTVVEGKIVRRAEGNNSVILQQDNIQAVLRLERNGKQKTWLLTGWDITTNSKEEKQAYLSKKGLASDEQGKVCTRHLPTQTEPILCRFCLGADESLIKIINQIKKKSTDYSAAGITEDKKIGCIVNEYLRDQRENPAAATVGKPLGTSAKQPYRNNIPQQGEIVNIDIQIPEDKAMDRQNILMDSKSKRSIDRNGFMHVELCSITKESVDPYFGREIPKYEELGLVPDRIYYGWRKGEELEKAAKTFCGLPLMREHHMDSSENPQREHRVGSVGTDCQWKAPYLVASLTVTDAEAIRKIENGERMELSAAYFFTPVLEKGEWNGKPYDFVMTDIQGNHVALVEEGRAGSDVCVADTAENIKNLTDEEKQMSQTEENKIPPAAEDTEKNEDAKTACDAEGNAESPAPQPVNDEDTDAEDFLQASGIVPSDETKKAFMAGMRYAAKKAEQSASPVPPAKDEDMKPEPNEPSARPAMDANSIKKQIREEMRAVQTAVRDVRPLVGEPGLTSEEVAFYDALTRPQAVKDFYENEELVSMTKELTELLRKKRTVDWQKKESARAEMWIMVKRLLKKYKYPPDGMEDAIKTVISQCEMWVDNG